MSEQKEWKSTWPNPHEASETREQQSRIDETKKYLKRKQSGTKSYSFPNNPLGKK